MTTRRYELDLFVYTLAMIVVLGTGLFGYWSGLEAGWHDGWDDRGKIDGVKR